MELKDAYKDMESLKDKTNERREELYKQNIEIVHMAAVPGTKYSYKGSDPTSIDPELTPEQATKINDIIRNAKGEIYPHIAKLAEKLNIDLEGC
jgi:hypothetical protein